MFSCHHSARLSVAGRSMYPPRLSGTISVKVILEGSTVSVRRGTLVTTLMVDGLAARRGSAVLAAALYPETPESVELRETEKARRRMEAAGLRIPPQRPDKRDRRARQRLKQESGEPE
jgi:ribosome-associated heat shock protein Hsp15